MLELVAAAYIAGKPGWARTLLALAPYSNVSVSLIDLSSYLVL